MQTQGKWSAGGGDDRERFFADLRALRDAVALGYDELAARAHYPSEVLKEAANGPSLPSLPILAAYVRACEADVPEWEERWRRLGSESSADPGLPVRPAGASPAAVAGARAGVSVAPPEAYDPERIKAALRGVARGRSDHGGIAGAAPGRTEPVAPDPAPAEPRAPESPVTSANWGDVTLAADAHALQGTDASWDIAPGWGTTTPGWDSVPGWDDATAETSGNGNRFAGQPGNARLGAAVAESLEEFAPAEVPDEIRAADALRRDPFSTAWLRDSERTPPSPAESAWQDEADTGASTAAQDDWFAPHQTARESGRPSASAEPSPVASPSWFTPREKTGTEQADSGLAPPVPGERDLASHVPGEFDVAPQREDGGMAPAAVTDLWTSSAAAPAPAQAQRTGPPVAGEAVSLASWSAPAEASSSATLSQADRMVRSQSVAPAPSRTMPAPVVPPALVTRRPDRLSPVRLLVVIVVAALIGSILVLILR